jgi:transposase
LQTDNDLLRIKAIQKELKQLKNLLIKKDLENLVNDSYLEIAAQDLGYKDVEELKK